MDKKPISFSDLMKKIKSATKVQTKPVEDREFSREASVAATRKSQPNMLPTARGAPQVPGVIQRRGVGERVIPEQEIPNEKVKDFVDKYAGSDKRQTKYVSGYNEEAAKFAYGKNPNLYRETYNDLTSGKTFDEVNPILAEVDSYMREKYGEKYQTHAEKREYKDPSKVSLFDDKEMEETEMPLEYGEYLYKDKLGRVTTKETGTPVYLNEKGEFTTKDTGFQGVWSGGGSILLDGTEAQVTNISPRFAPDIKPGDTLYYNPATKLISKVKDNAVPLYKHGTDYTTNPYDEQGNKLPPLTYSPIVTDKEPAQPLSELEKASNFIKGKATVDPEAPDTSVWLHGAYGEVQQVNVRDFAVFNGFDSLVSGWLRDEIGSNPFLKDMVTSVYALGHMVSHAKKGLLGVNNLKELITGKPKMFKVDKDGFLLTKSAEISGVPYKEVPYDEYHADQFQKSGRVITEIIGDFFNKPGDIRSGLNFKKGEERRIKKFNEDMLGTEQRVQDIYDKAEEIYSERTEEGVSNFLDQFEKGSTAYTFWSKLVGDSATGLVSSQDIRAKRTLAVREEAYRKSKELTESAFKSRLQGDTESAISQRMEAIKITALNSAGLENYSPYFGYTFLTQPILQERFYRGVAEAEMQLGRELEPAEVIAVRDLYTNPWDEMFGDMVVDITNFYPVSKAIGLTFDLAKAKVLKPVVKGIKEIPLAGRLIQYGSELSIRSTGKSLNRGATYALASLASNYSTSDEFVKALTRIGDGAIIKKSIDGTQSTTTLLERALPDFVKPRDKAMIYKLVNVFTDENSAVNIKKWADLASEAKEKVKSRHIVLNTKKFGDERAKIMAKLTKEMKGALSGEDLYGYVLSKAPSVESVSRRAEELAETFANNPKNIINEITDRFEKQYIKTNSPFKNVDITNDSLMYKVAEIFGKKNSENVKHTIIALSVFGSRSKSFWTDAVLALRPAWVINNIKDSFPRAVLFGVSVLDGRHLMGADSPWMKSMNKKMIPKELMETFAAQYQDSKLTRITKLIEGEPIKYGGLGLIADQWRSRKNHKEIIGAMADKNWLARTISNTISDPLYALKSGIKDYSSVVEFTLRVRLYDKLFRESFNLLDPRGVQKIEKLFDILGTTPEAKAIVKELWNISQADPDMLFQLLSSFQGKQTMPIYRTMVMGLLPDNFDELFIGLPADKSMVIKEHIFTEFSKYLDLLHAADKPIDENSILDFYKIMKDDINSKKVLAGVGDLRDPVGIDLDAAKAASNFGDEAIDSMPTEGVIPGNTPQQILEDAPEVDPRTAVIQLHSARGVDEVVQNFKIATKGMVDITIGEDTGNKIYKLVKENGKFRAVINPSILTKEVSDAKKAMMEISEEIMIDLFRKQPDPLLETASDVKRAVKNYLKNPDELFTADKDLYTQLDDILSSNRQLKATMKSLGGLSKRVVKTVEGVIEKDANDAIDALVENFDIPLGEAKKLVYGLPEYHKQAGEALAKETAPLSKFIENLDPSEHTKTLETLKAVDDGFTRNRELAKRFLIEYVVTPGKRDINSAGGYWDRYANISTNIYDNTRKVYSKLNKFINKGDMDGLTKYVKEELPTTDVEIFKEMGIEFSFKNGRLSSVLFKNAEATGSGAMRPYKIYHDSQIHGFLNRLYPGLTNNETVEILMNHPTGRRYYSYITGKIDEEYLRQMDVPSKAVKSEMDKVRKLFSMSPNKVQDAQLRTIMQYTAQSMTNELFTFEGRGLTNKKWMAEAKKALPWFKDAGIPDNAKRIDVYRALHELVTGEGAENEIKKGLRESLAKQLEWGSLSKHKAIGNRFPHPYVMRLLGHDMETVGMLENYWKAGVGIDPYDLINTYGDHQKNMDSYWKSFIKTPIEGEVTLQQLWGNLADTPEEFAGYLRDIIDVAKGDKAYSRSMVQSVEMLLWQIENFRNAGANMAESVGLMKPLITDSKQMSSLVMPISAMPPGFSSWFEGNISSLAMSERVIGILDELEAHAAKSIKNGSFRTVSDDLAQELFNLAKPISNVKTTVTDLSMHGKVDDLMETIEELIGHPVSKDLTTKKVKGTGWVKLNENDKILIKSIKGLATDQDEILQGIGRLKGALPETGRIMIDYGDNSKFDEFMRTVFPFWKFTQGSVPMWIDTFMHKPWVLSAYMKYIRTAHRFARFNGAVDSNGNVRSTMKGKIRIPGTDTWIDPMSGVSMKFILPNFERYEDLNEPSLWGKLYVYVNEMGRVFGASMSPWLTIMAKLNGWNEGGYPTGSIFPQTNLIPIWHRRSITEALNKMGVKTNGIIMGEDVPWRDHLIEQRMLANLIDENYKEGNYIENAMEIKKALEEREGNPLWDKTQRELEKEEWFSQMSGYFTSFYLKQYSDADVRLSTIKRDIDHLKEMINNDVGADIFGMSPSASVRNDVYIDKAYDTDEGYINRLTNLLRFVTDQDTGELLTGEERRKGIMQRMAEDELRSAKYDSIAMTHELYQSQLRALPVGADRKLKSAIMEKYIADLAAIDNNEMFKDISTDWMAGYKPEEDIVEHWVDEWFKIIESTKPGFVEDEDYNVYLAREAEWYDDITSVMPEAMKSLEAELIRSLEKQQLGMEMTFGDTLPKEVELPGDRILKVQELIKYLQSITTKEKFKGWELSNDSVTQALDKAWSDMVLTPYFDGMEGLNSFDAARYKRDFGKKIPSNEALINRVIEMYPGRFTQKEISEALVDLSERDVLSPDERLAPQNEQEAMDDRTWNTLLRAGLKVNDLMDIYAKKDGYYASDLSVWYAAEEWKNPEDKLKFQQRLEEAAEEMGLPAEVSNETLAEWSDAKKLNEDLKQLIPSTLGEDINEVMQTYWDANSAERRKLRKADERIDKYYDLREQFADQHPLWEKYYVQKDE